MIPDKETEGKYTLPDGTTKTGIRLKKARFYVIDYSRTSNEYKSTTLHELGHALGWYGHSTRSTDVMYWLDTKDITSFCSLFTRDCPVHSGLNLLDGMLAALVYKRRDVKLLARMLQDMFRD